MSARTIRVIKPSSTAVAVLIQPDEVLEGDFQVNREHTHTVNDWISEHRENGRLEAVFSRQTLAAWERVRVLS